MRRVLPAWLRIPVWLAVGILATAIYFLGQLDNERSSREREALERAKLVLHAGKVYRQHRQQLLAAQAAAVAVAVQATQQATRQLRSADSLSRRADSLWTLAQAALPTSQAAIDLRPVVLAYQEANDSLKATVGSQQLALDSVGSALRLANGRAALAEGRVTSLEQALHDLVKTSQCRIVGLLPCPSRTVVAVVGVGTGLALSHLKP